MTDLGLDTDQMFRAAATLAAMHANSDEHFRTGHQRLSGALAEGWIGSSAQTMAGVMNRWQTRVEGMVARVDGHATGISKATNQLAQQDDIQADSITSTSDAALNL